MSPRRVAHLSPRSPWRQARSRGGMLQFFLSAEFAAQLPRNFSRASNPFSIVSRSVANDMPGIALGPECRAHHQRHVGLARAVMQNDVESITRLPPSVRPKCCETFMNA